MKENGKSKTPIIAAKTKKNNDRKPAPKKARVSRVNSAADEMKVLVLDRISDGLMGFDADMNSTYVNQRAGEILGCEPETLLGKNFQEAYPDSTGTPFADAFQRALETQNVVPFESYFPASESFFAGRVYPAADGAAVLFTDRKDKNAVDISKLPEQNPYPVLCLARDGNVLYANQAAVKLLESWHNEGQGIPAEMEQLLPLVLDHHENREVEFKTEGRIYIGLMVPIAETGHVNIYCRDITERTQSNESLRALIKQTTTGITRTDLEGRFTFVNQAYCDMLGYSEAELLGKTIWDVTHPDDMAKSQRLYERLKTGEPYQVEKRLVRRNGAILWITVGTSPLLDAAGNMWAASSIVVDITRRKRAEESLLDSARRTLYLGTLSDTIRSLSEPSQIQTEAVNTLGAYLKASRVAYLEIAANGHLASRARYLDSVTDVIGLVNIHQYLPDDMLAKLAAGRSIIITDVKATPGYGEEFQAFYEANSIHSQVMVPALRNEQLVAVLCVQQSSAREWKNEEIHLIEETLERTQAAIERVRAEQNVVESEKRFRILANTVPSIVWSTSSDGHILYFNDQWYAYTGLTPEETTSNWAELTIHPDDYERSMSAWNQALETVPEEYLSELRYRRYDGEYRWFQSHAIPARDENGNVTAWYGVTTDIHDRMQTETALRESEERLRLATQAAHLCTWELDIPSQTYKLGDNFEEVVGFSREYLPQNSNEVTDRINMPEDLQAVRETLIEAVKSRRDEVSGLQYRLIHPVTEDIIWVEVNAKLVYDNEGKPLRMFGMLQNITGRRRKEEERHAQEAELQAIINQTPFMLTRCSRDLRYRFVSRTYAEMIGRAPEDVAGKPILEIMGKDGWSTVAPYVERVLKGERVEYEAEVPFDGFGAPALHVIYTPDYDEQGDVIGWFASITDVTERKAAENERIQLLEREQAQRLAAEQSKLEAEQARAIAEQELTQRKLAEQALGAWTDAPLSQDIRAPWLRYGMAIVATLIAVLARALLDPVVGDFVQFTTLFGAVAFSVWYGGTGPALVSAILGYVGISWLILDWQHFIGPTAGSWLGLFIVLFSSTVIIALGGAMRRAQRHAHQSARVAVERQRQAEFRLAEQKRAEEALLASEAKLMVELEDSKQLQNISSQLIQENNIQALYEQIVDAATALMRSEMGSMQMLYPDKKELRLLVSKGFDPASAAFWEWVRPASSSTCGMALQTGQRVVISDVETSDLMAGSEDLDFYRLSKIRAVQSTPLISRDGHIVGMISTHWNRVHQPSERELQMLDLLARQAADLIERRRAEEALTRERELFRLLFETMPVMVSMYDPKTQSMRLNAEFQRVLGWKAEEVTAGSLLESLYPDPDYRNQVLQQMAAAAGKNEWVEAQIQTRDERALDSLWSNISIMNDKEIVTGIAIGIDITERKQAERALAEYARQQEALYKLADQLHQTNTLEEIFDASLDAICNGIRSDRASILLFDDQDVMRFVAWRDLSDEYRNATDGHSPWKPDEKNAVPIFYNDIDTAELSESLRAIIKEEGIGSLAFIPLISSGNLIGKFMIYFNTPHEFSEAELDLSLTIARQLASAVDRKRADDELRASEELYRAIARNIPGGGVYVVDRDFRYIVADGPVTEAFGLSPEKLEGRTVSEVFPDERGQRMEERLRQNFAGEIVNFETKHDDRVYWTQQAPLHDSIGQAIIVTMDITERKRAEDALRRNEEMFSTLVNSAPFGVYFIDSEFRLRSINKGSEAVFSGIDPLLGRDFAEIVHIIWQEPFATEAIERFRHTLRTGESFISPTIVEERANINEIQAYDWQIHRITLSDGTFGVVCYFYDLSEQKRMEATVRASERLYRAIARSIPGGGVYVVDKDFRYIVAEGEITEAFGLSREMLEGRTVGEVFLDEQGRQTEERIRKNFAGEIVNFETQHNGRVYWTQQAPLNDSIGQAIIVTMDITERKQAEERLRASEEKYRRIVETANEGIWEIDKDTRTMFVNRRMAEMLGYTVEEMIGRPVFDFLLPEDYSEGERRLESAKQGESARTREFRYRRKDNSILWTVASNTAERDEQGNLLGAFAMMSDITERKQAEEALRQSEERFARFMQYLPGLAWIKDVQGRYIFANAAAEQAFNTPRDQLYGRTDDEIFRPEEAEQFRRNDEQVVREEKGTQVVEQLRQDDGILHYSLVTKFPIPGPDGNITLIGGTAFDITERVQMEEAIRQAREQAEATADRMSRLQQITAAFTQTLTPVQLAELALEQGTRAAGAATGALAELISNGQELKIIASLGYPDGVVPTNPTPISELLPLAACIQTGQASWLGSQQEFALQYPQSAEQRRSLGLEALVLLPLIVGNQTLGGLVFSFAEQREFLAEERGFFLSLAHQCAQALERARAADALRESEERYRAIVNQATAGIVRKDPDGRLIFVNEAFCEMLGFGQAELLGRTMWELTHEEDVRESQRLYNVLMHDGLPFELEKRLVRKDGAIVWAMAGVSPVMDASGNPQSAVSVYTDITDRKQAEQDLRESRERYRDLFNLVPIAVYTTDSNGLIQEYNRTAIELWGREPIRNDPSERYCGSFKLYFPDGRFMPHRKCPMARMLAGETPQPEELEIIVERRDGSRRNVVAHPLPLRNERGEIIGAINCLYDITPRKQAEKRLSLLAEVSELTRGIEEPDELMAAVAHSVGRHLQVRRCLFNEIDLEHDLEIVQGDYHDGVPSVNGTHQISEYSNLTTAEIASGKTIVNHDSKIDPRTADDYERSYMPNRERAYVAVPLMRDDRWVASLWVSDDLPRQWDPEDVALIESVAERTWTATEKLRINSALRDSEERLRVTFNTTAVGFATLAPDTSFIDVNEAFCHIVGYSRQELLSMNCNMLTHPDFLEDTRQHVAQLLAGQISSFVLEKLYVRKNGAEIWVQNSVSVVRDAEGAPLHLIAIIQDITERRQTEEALQRLNAELESRVEVRTAELKAANEYLRESEETSRIIIESMPDAIVITDRDGRIVHCNAQVESLFGYRPEEALGEFVELLMPARFHESHLEYRRIFNDDRYPRLMGLGKELFGLRKDQSEFPIEMLLSPISNKTNWDVMITIRDNTEQRKAQEAIRTNEEKLRTLFELLPVGISFLDNEGRITEMNPALTAILGLSKGELLRGKYKDRRYVQSDGSPMPPENLASIRAHAEHKSIYDVETGIVKENGETIWTSVNAAPVDVADVDVVVATIDITARKKAEEALRRNRERLRVLSRRLVEVQEDERRAIARELHDRVGQNLAALNLNLNILRSQLSQDTIAQVGGRISDSVGLVNQILTITRNVMSDLRSNVLDDYGLESAIREYADQFTQRTGVRVVIERPTTPIPRLQSGIEMTLLRIAQEALTNVARHAQASQATITMHADSQDIYMSVQDDGIGILSWQKANQPGSHGLRIIRERAEAFDGSLQVNSAYKKGTTIEVRIPLGRNNE